MPVWVPRLLSMVIVGEGVPVAVQERVTDCPWVILEGLAVKEEILGAVEVEAGGLDAEEIVTVIWAVALPPLLVAVKV